MSLMEYVKLGRGSKTFVLISGIGMTSVLSSSEAVGNLYGRFLEDYTLYLFDRGEILPSDLNVSAMAQDTVEILQAEGVTEAVFTGMSQGGMIAQQIAIDYPSMVTKLIICSSCCGPNEIAVQVLARLRELSCVHDVKGINNAFVDLVYSETTKEKFGEFFKAHELDGTPEQCERFVVLLDACRDFDCRARLSEIKCPVLVLGSLKDKVLGGEGSLEIARILNCQIYMYEGYGHAVYDEAPDFLDRIEKFVLS